MGYGSRILHMIFIIFMIISFHCTHILVVNAANYFNDHGIQEEYYMENSEDWKQSHIEKVSGGNENEEKPAFILEKFRALLGLNGFKRRRRRTSNGDLEYVSPSPAPLITIDAPIPPIHVHSHHPTTPNYKEDRDKRAKTLVAVFVSAGLTIVLCGIGLICGCQKFRKKKKKKKSTSTVSIYSTEEGIRGNSVKKVSSNPGPDLFYLDSLATAIESQPFYSYEKSSTNILLHEEEKTEQELMKSEYDNCSAVGEIMSVHETAECIDYDRDGCRSHSSSSPSGDITVTVEAHSSDDESFHSFYDSHSSNMRLSNASASSLGETPEIMEQNTITSPCFSNDQKNFRAPPTPPPPPPPPLRNMQMSPSHSSSLSTQITSKCLNSSSCPNLSSRRDSDSSSGSNQTPQNDLRPSAVVDPPPKSPGGIPPPPCTPPFLRGNSETRKCPPPPPFQLSQFTSLGKDGAPLPKLKPLHWDKVRAAPDRSMVWDKLKSSSFEFDEEMIKSLFGYNLQNSMKNGESKSKTPSPSKHVLEPKRLQNITILSKALNVTVEQVCDALIQGDGLCLQQLESLVKMEPTKEEEAKLRNYKGDISELGSAEKFVKVLLNIPFSFLRIEAMLYKETFEDEVVHLRKSLSMLEEACKELRSSRLFLKLLEAVLKTGNRMNVGTIRGGARAFKLDALLKLADVKGTDGITTLLHFVVQEIVRSEGIRVSQESIVGKINQKNKSKKNVEEDYRKMGLDLVSGLSTEFYNVKKTATIDVDVLASCVSNLSDGMTKLQFLVCKVDGKNGNFVHSMKLFLNYAERNLKELKEDEDRVLLHVREITEYFHGDVSKDESNPLRIFVIVRDFLSMLDHVCKELRSIKVVSNPNPLAPFR